MTRNYMILHGERNMFDFDKEKLEGYIQNLKEPRVLIIGDMGIDEMVKY